MVGHLNRVNPRKKHLARSEENVGREEENDIILGDNAHEYIWGIYAKVDEKRSCSVLATFFSLSR